MSDWLWRILQMSIVAAVVCWSIYDKAPGSPLAHGVVGIMVAWLLTTFPVWLFGRVNRYRLRRKSRILARNQPPQRDFDLLGPE